MPSPMSSPPRAVAVVSGAGSGIGAAIARALAARGDAVALLGRSGEPLARLAAELGAAAVAYPVDVRDATRLAAVAERIEREQGGVGVVVAAAGVARVGRLTTLTPEEVRDTVETNLLGTAFLFRAFLPPMLSRRRGALVPLLSVAARKAFPDWSAYCASKWGTLGLVEALREELAGSGVRIVALTPGATETPLWNEVPGEWNRARMIPAEEVARALVWALGAGERVEVEEIRLQPPGGDL
jgi:NADP-dependent 3-hydroxy acid dehydrogenase YdfG